MKSIKQFLDGVLWLLVGDRPLTGLKVDSESRYTYVPDPKPKPMSREQQEAILLCKAIGIILKEEGEKNRLKVEVRISPMGEEPPDKT
ncbi:hypothetical protein KI659_16675 [Litoribacter alkaliphilus]|uniref:Uncharacterized protein n=1 Tax=Litoribacter ruber TaxID=702568 RepID=A0AAP2CKK4_9BACT|nr:hypothetical protein [Litoribacter alkaliphilus]MBS9525655.1 hypothetical protein [Litoribacter alkaliphilus]